MGNATVRIPEEDFDKVRVSLKKLGFEERKVKNTLWSLKGEEGTANLYPSGILLIQGKSTQRVLEAVLNSITPIRENIAGMDESGKGDVFGALVLSACVIEPENYKRVLEIAPKDSKNMKDEEVIRKAKEIKEACWVRSIVIMPERYNELIEEFKNLTSLMNSAYRKLLDAVLKEKGAKRIVIDRYTDREPFSDIEGVLMIEKAERFPEVSCASIIAREKFLKSLRALSNTAGIELPKGSSKDALELARKILREKPDLAKRIAKLSFIL